MSKVFKSIGASLIALSMSCVYANENISSQDVMTFEMPETSSPAAGYQPVAAPVKQVVVQAPPVVKVPEMKAISPFTGSVKGKKVRLRLQADIDSQIIRELDRNELISIVGEKGDFYAVQPPQGIKAYVFRSFILDNVVEGNRVNVRLEPTLEAPIIGHLNAGEKIQGQVCAQSSKWLEIAPPESTRFYIAKEYVDNVGGPDVKAKAEKRKTTAEQLFESTGLLAKAEMMKSFEEIDMDRISRNYNTIMKDYGDLSELHEKAHEALTTVQEAYLQKRIAYLENRANQPSEEALAEENAESGSTTFAVTESITDKMKLWEPIEEALYLTWSNINESKSMEEYYDEQMLAAAPITGILEEYHAPVKNKPGDFILRDKDLPVAYIYSSAVNLQSYIGKKVTLLGSPRPNNYFAFPAYYVLSVEQ